MCGVTMIPPHLPVDVPARSALPELGVRAQRALRDDLRPRRRGGRLAQVQWRRDEVAVALDAAAEQPARAHAQLEGAQDLSQLGLLAEGLHLQPAGREAL